MTQTVGGAHPNPPTIPAIENLTHRQRRFEKPMRSQRLTAAWLIAPAAVLGLLRRMGADPPPIIVVGCEPASLEEAIGLSDAVAASVDEAVRIVTELVEVKGLGIPAP